MEVLAFDRTLTELDHARLRHLVRGQAHDALDGDAMQGVLDAARLVPSREVAPDVVTMYSQVELGFPHGRGTYTVCYPEDAEPSAGFVSVLSPLGTSLLGLTVGARATWRTPLGEVVSAEVLAIRFQPEASGDYTL